MNSLTRIMSYDNTKIKNQENCNCVECTTVEVENQIVGYPPLSDEEIEQIINERYFNKDEKTKTFIRKALKKHGDRYDYSNVVYVKSSKKVEIICKVKGHKPFPQTPDNHLKGKGCKVCAIERRANKRKLTTEKFIEKANKKHGVGRYDYSKVKYVDCYTDVNIICHNHDVPYEFPQAPYLHLQGHGCDLCAMKTRADKRRKTVEEFIEEANEVHGIGRYDYSKVNYVDNKTEVIIICHNHETPYEFPQTPSHHLSGNGCKLCGIKNRADKRRLTLEEFIERSRKIHGNKYDYSKVNYINNSTDVIITCPIHGDFPQAPSNHLSGKGCLDCAYEKLANDRKLTLEEFIERANKLHGVGTYDYSQVKYVNRQTEVIIICPKHGPFPQRPNDHLSDCGCPKCRNYIGEIKVRNFLTEHDIKFEEQKKFKDCKDSNSLPFDFYIPMYNLCIEYDGIQHFIPTSFKKSTKEETLKSFEYIQKHDQIKNNYCKDKGMNLLRIRYDENVEEKLMNYFENLY